MSSFLQQKEESGKERGMNEKWIYRIENLKLDNEELLLNETIFHNANGYLGVRSNFEEGYPEGYDTIRGSYINGFYDISEMKQAEKLYGMAEKKETMLNVADGQTIRLYLEEEEFSMFSGTVLSSERWLDMESGITARKVLWRSPEGREAEIVIRRMASFSHLHLFTIDYQVTPLNFSGRICFMSEHEGNVQNYCNPNDPRVAGESFQHLIPDYAEICDGVSYLYTNTATSGLQVCTAVKNVLKGAERTVTAAIPVMKGHRSVQKLTADAGQGEVVQLIKYMIFADSLRCPDLKKQTSDEMTMTLAVPLEQIYREQREYLDRFWTSSALEIEGDDHLCASVRYNQYQLIQSVGKDPHSNIAAKGLSGEGYEGHYFWDTEMYIQPFFTLTNPQISRNLIEYRYSILDKARENAKILGHKQGAAYPWRTIHGTECSGFFPAGSAQYHISGDIAYSTVAYYLMTGDLVFMAEKGAEIVFETARLWMDLGNYYHGAFQIHEVTGPDEYTCLVSNNYYTNLNAQYNLHWAVRLYRLLEEKDLLAPVKKKIRLREEEIEEFKKAEKAMYLPYDEELGINPQDDSFLRKEVWDFAGTPKENYPLLMHYHPMYIYRYQVCKQADTVLAHFIFEDAQDVETIRRSFAYYEQVTTHDSSLSTCIFSIVASKLGQVDKAYEYFGNSAMLDLFNTHKNTKDGIHTANMGGTYMAIVYGFGGFRLKESGIWFAPVLPEKWKAYNFMLNYRGSHILVRVSAEGTEFTLESGSPVELHVYEEKYCLEGRLSLGLKQTTGVTKIPSVKAASRSGEEIPLSN